VLESLDMTMPSWVPGEETKPAPMPLLLVQSFVNTWDGDHGSDLLLDPAAARDWMTAAGLWNAGRAPEPTELDPARRVRESIRAMLVANGGGPQPAPADLHAIQAAAQAARPTLQVGPGGQVSLRADSTGPLDAALVTLLLAIRDAQRDGTWQRLKSCGNPDCRWAFLRPLPQPGRCLVRHGHLRQPDQEPQAPATPALTTACHQPGLLSRRLSTRHRSPATASLLITQRGGAQAVPRARTA
jgi:predicted RNA-binding Zn ribbon-like protein